MSQHAVSRCALAAWACYLMAACCTSAQYPLLPKRVRSLSAPAALAVKFSRTSYNFQPRAALCAVKPLQGNLPVTLNHSVGEFG
jgi:hypothetical protein